MVCEVSLEEAMNRASDLIEQTDDVVVPRWRHEGDRAGVRLSDPPRACARP
jgi:hypothetical protein